MIQGATELVLMKELQEDDMEGPLSGVTVIEFCNVAAGSFCGMLLADLQAEHMDWVQSLELPNGVSTRTFASPVRFSGKAQVMRRSPPRLGEHTEEVLASLDASASA